MNFDEFLTMLKSKSYNELLSLATNLTGNLLEDFKIYSPEYNGKFIFFTIVLSVIGIDGNLSPTERRFIGDFLRLNDSEIQQFIAIYRPETADRVIDFANRLTKEKRATFCALIATIAACDKTITREEYAYLDYFIS